MYQQSGNHAVQMTNKDNMVYIIGAGAIGKALAVMLKHNGRDVVLVRGSVDDGRIANDEITLELAGGKKYVQTITVLTLSAIKRFEGTVVLTSKSFGNDKLAAKLGKRNNQFPIVLLQNGLGIEAPFLHQGYHALYRGVLFATSQASKDTVSFRQVSASPVGVVKGSVAALNAIVASISTPEFTFSPTAAIEKAVWQKTIINTVFNSVCPLLDIDNGIFHRDEYALVLARNIISACVKVANSAGIAVNAHEIEEGLLQISKVADGQLISTLQDIRAGRPTEIETLNFEIDKIAQSMQMQELTKEILLLGKLIKIKSATQQRRRAPHVRSIAKGKMLNK
ncbi:2-dehydropantoate 2-reductase [Parapedobacter composti]|uniref:2-dehydropantoate 2-reductase n=1 Tax=Parapedobacter composti TaxID=623281 RepID=A0A1I1LTY0_9SPHI|nr:ketopantoate reductase C-terminal domain-containing protein [Parapedobacter composti]SFC74398.1 2-dehydropantoate 2-reductase [Parapedobacter composti]